MLGYIAIISDFKINVRVYLFHTLKWMLPYILIISDWLLPYIAIISDFTLK